MNCRGLAASPLRRPCSRANWIPLVPSTVVRDSREPLQSHSVGSRHPETGLSKRGCEMCNSVKALRMLRLARVGGGGVLAGVSLGCLIFVSGASAQANDPNLSKQPTLYVVGYAHLDTEWRWEYPQVINEYLRKTMKNNFALFEKYPHYVFNFSGANRYRLMKEYYPSDFERLKQYVAAGRWFPAGSSMEEGDVNSPNAESIIRQVLYCNNWFRKEFGTASDEYMLPDCFGFPASLPSILAHSGIKGFSTQKLSSGWQPAPHVGGPDSPEQTPVGIPFNVGIWEGPDGRTVIAALNPLGYGSQVTYDLSKSPQPPPPPDPNLTAQQNQQRTRAQEDWVKRIDINGNLTGVFADYHYVGTGDVGGSPNESSVSLMEAITTRDKAVLPQSGPVTQQQSSHQETARPPLVQVGDGPIKVVWSKADQMFLDIL